MQQLRLPLDQPYSLVPSKERREPVVWVRRLRVLAELKPSEDAVIRDVVLRRGLNIVWAPPHPPGSGKALVKSGMAGHTAGKTTFCRLLRYALGEQTFASEGTRKRIRAALPSAWVAAEVMVGGQLWTVARPLSVGPHPFCIEGGTIEQATSGAGRLPYDMFLGALGNATVGGLPAAQYPSTDQPVRWEHLLPWLARDQECRFADFIEWRHSSSASDAPSLNVDERQFLVRSVLGLITDEERREQKRNARLLNQRKEAAQDEPLYAHQAGVDHRRVEQILGMKLPFPPTGLFGQQARRELEDRTEDLKRREASLSSTDRRAELRADLEAATEQETNAQRNLQEAETRLTVEKVSLEGLTGKSRGDAQVALLASLPPSREYCSVRLSDARKHGCPLAASRPIDLAEHRCERSAEEELENQRQLVRSLEEAVHEHRLALNAAQAERRAARLALMSASTAYDEARGKLLEERAQLRHLSSLIQEAESAWNRSASLAVTIKGLSADIEDSYAKQQQLRIAGERALRLFSDTFNFIVRSILGDEVQAYVDSSGRSLSLVVEHNGERASAALETIKLLAFDLAALTASMEGGGFHPRFLLHDGPREADLALDVYEQLFHVARLLEGTCEGEPQFQYILTTTTPPPVGFLGEPCLKLKLAGVPASERFLRADL